MSAPLQPDCSLPIHGPEVDQIIECNRVVKGLGIDSTITLPQICVIGDQSTGKSSLIEALSNTKVPRAAGCCTQCPITINLSPGENSSSPFKCKVIIEERYEYNGLMRSKQPTKSKPLGPWVQIQEPRFFEFATTSNRSELRTIIAHAQRAVLNPGGSSAAPSSQNMGQATAIKFSPNVVRLDISEGMWPNLSFVDLPGVITNMEGKENSFLIDLVENLVRSYAEAPNSINLLTLPMTNDIANSKSYALIQKIEAESRTMAVFTKPDRVQDEGSMAQYMGKFLEEENMTFEHGYHMVMMAPDVDLSHEDARKREAEFFEREPWASLDARYRARLGVTPLSNHLRQLLFQKTLDTLPNNLQSIKQRLSMVQQELSSRPPPPHAAHLPMTVLKLTSTFAERMQRMFTGTGQALGLSLWPEWKKLVGDFRAEIVNAKPTMFIRTKEEGKQLSLAEVKIRRRIASSSATKRAATDDLVELSSDDEEPTTARKAVRPKQESTLTDQAKEELTYRFGLEEIRAENERFDIGALPGQPSPLAIDELAKKSVRGWNTPLRLFIHRTSILLNAEVQKLVTQVFASHERLPLYQTILDWVKSYMDAEINEEWIKLDAVCEMERMYPYTLDIEAHKIKSSIAKEERQAKRNLFRLKVLQAMRDASAPTGKSKKLTEADLPPDPYGTEVMMSAVSIFWPPPTTGLTYHTGGPCLL